MPSRALVLAYFASMNRSVFAAQCLVECCIQLLLQGRTFDDIQVSEGSSCCRGGYGVGFDDIQVTEGSR